MTKLRIAAFGFRTLPPAAGAAGADKFALELLPRLAKKGHSVIAYNRRYSNVHVELEEFKGVKIKTFKTFRKKGFDTLWHSFKCTMHIIFRNTADIVHIQNGGNSIWALPLRLFGKKVFISQDGVDWKRDKWPWYAKIYLKLSSYISAYFPNDIIFDNVIAKNLYEKRFRKNFTFIPFGSEVEKVHEDDAVLKKYGLEKGEYYLFVGRFIPDKGLQYLIPAFSQSGSTKKLVLVGGSPNPSAFENELRSGAGSNVLFPGFVYGDDVTRLMLNAYCYIQPSDVEGLSPVILSVMGLGVPLIVSDIEENRYAVQDTATTFRKGDIDSLAEKIRFAENNHQAMKDLSVRAKDRSLTEFNWDHVTDEHEKVFCRSRKKTGKEDPALTAEKKLTSLATFNKESMFQKNVMDKFAEMVEKYPSHNAFCINERFYTYFEFAQHVSKIRSELKDQAKGSNIGFVTNDDIETYASIFAIWMEGLTYVPLHHQNPVDRSLEIISQADIQLVLNSGDAAFPGTPTIKTTLLGFSELDMVPATAGDEVVAYILFTSGSTGKPKGVPISRKSVDAFITSFMEAGIKIDQTDRCLQSFDLTFDVSVQCFLVPLLNGACMYTIPHDQIKYSYAYGLLDDHALTMATMPPSMVRYLRPYFDEINIPSMRYFILTAEASPLELVEAWSACIPNSEIYDFYGPTEATIYCTYNVFNRNGLNKHLNGLYSIGKPMNGIEAIIIDEEMNIVGKNIKGELCVSGAQLTNGYLNNPERNKQVFIDVLVNNRSTRFYKTGDLCYTDDDGDIMYSGRLDYQVKVQGYRIELGEIEHHARQCAEGRNAVAIPFESNTGHTEIALFVEGDLSDSAILRDLLKTRLPHYMIPTKYLTKDVFPLNTNGKVDRNQLKVLIA